MFGKSRSVSVLPKTLCRNAVWVMPLLLLLLNSQLDKVLDKYAQHKKFRGVRNILEAEADDWLAKETVHRGLGE